VSIVGKSYLISLVKGTSDLLRIPEQLANDLGTKGIIETTAQKPDGRKLPIRLNLNDRTIIGLGPWIRTGDDEIMRSVRLKVLSERPYTFSVEFSDQVPPPRNTAENAKISRPDKGLYLGSKALLGFLEITPTGEAVAVEETDLLRHVFICGATGSGKTVLSKVIIEEAALKGIPVIAIDLTGDISSMAIMLSGEDPAELIPWVAPKRGESREAKAATVAAKHKANLERWGLRYKDVEEFRKKVVVNVFTPCSNAGFRLAFSAFVEPPEDLEKLKERDSDSFEDISRFINQMAQTFVSRLNLTKRQADKAKGYIYEIVKHFWEGGINLRGYDGIKRILDEVRLGQAGIEQIGGMPTVDYISSKDRDNISDAINALLTGDQKSWFQGFPVDIETLINPNLYDGRTPVTVINIEHLNNFNDRAYVVGYIAYLIWFWMKGHGGIDEPRLIFYVDEIGGGGSKEAFFPPVAISPCKPALNLLLRLGRGNGVCCMFATQSPGDIDYKAMSQCKTLVVGQLSKQRERKKIEEMAGKAGYDFESVAQHIPDFNPGRFWLKTPTLPSTIFDGRWVMHPIHRRLSKEYIEQLKEDYEKEVSVLFHEVEKLLKANKLSSAKNILESVIKCYRFSILCVKAYLQLGKVLYDMGDYETAIRKLQEMIKHRMEAEETGEAYFLLGKCRECQGYFKDAANEFAKVADSGASEEVKESALKHEQYCKNRAAWPELTTVQKFFWWITGRKPDTTVLIRLQIKDKELLEEEFRASITKEDFVIPEPIDFQELIDAKRKAEAEQKEKEVEQIKAEDQARAQVPKIEAYLQKGALQEAFKECGKVIQRLKDVNASIPDSVIPIIKKCSEKCNEYRNEKEQGLNKRVLTLPARQFEFEIANLFRCKGYKSHATQFTNDDGVDVLASIDQEKIIIQCKRWTHPVGRSVVDELAGVQKRYGANRAILAATSTFTDGAKDAAHKHNIELWDFYKIRLEWQQALNVE